MTISLGVHASAGSTTGNASTTPARTTQVAGSTFAIGVVSDGTAGNPVVTSSKGGTPVLVGSRITSTGGGFTQKTSFFKLVGGVGGSGHTFTATLSGAYPSIFMQEIIGTNVDVDQFSQVNDTATPWESGTLTPSANGCLAVALHGLASSFNPATSTPAAGWTKQEEVSDSSAYYVGALATWLQTTATAIKASWTAAGSSGDWGSSPEHLVIFKEAGGGPSNSGKMLQMF